MRCSNGLDRILGRLNWHREWSKGLPTQIAPQTGIGATSMLTLIAYQFALSSSLPRISYLTRADFFLLWSLVLVFTALAEAIATAALMNYGKETVVRKMDWLFRAVYPLAFVLILILAAF